MSHLKVLFAPCCDLYSKSNQKIKKQLSGKYDTDIVQSIKGAQRSLNFIPPEQIQNKIFWENHLLNLYEMLDSEETFAVNIINSNNGFPNSIIPSFIPEAKDAILSSSDITNYIERSNGCFEVSIKSISEFFQSILPLLDNSLSSGFFKNADLQKLDLSNSRISFTDFTGADISNSQFKETVFDNCLFNEANLSHAKFTPSDKPLENWWDIANNLSGFINCHFQNAKFIGVDFANVFFESHKQIINFNYADLSNSIFGSLTFLHPENWPFDFFGATLRNAVFEDLSLPDHSRFSQSDFTNGQITNFRNRHGLFENTNMKGTTITNSDLRQSNIVEANLNETHWTGTNDLREAVIDNTQGENIKVEGVMYLQGAKLNPEMTSILKSPNIHSALDFSLRKEVSNFLQNYLPPIQKQFPSINRIGLFGSIAKGTNIEGSDLDFVVDTGNQFFYEEDKEQLRELLSAPLKQNFPSINPTNPLKDLYSLQELTEKGERYINEIHWINSL